jgi:hemin uptake protein HemP
MANSYIKQRIISLQPGLAGASRISSTQLLATEGKLLIDHRGEEYLLRVTRNGRLILTK